LKNLRSGSSGAEEVAEGERTYIHKYTLKEPCVPYAYQPPLRSLRPPRRLDRFIRCQDRMYENHCRRIAVAPFRVPGDL
jgi:hypothetical protein